MQWTPEAHCWHCRRLRRHQLSGTYGTKFWTTLPGMVVQFCWLFWTISKPQGVSIVTAMSSRMLNSSVDSRALKQNASSTRGSDIRETIKCKAEDRKGGRAQWTGSRRKLLPILLSLLYRAGRFYRRASEEGQFGEESLRGTWLDVSRKKGAVIFQDCFK